MFYISGTTNTKGDIASRISSMNTLEELCITDCICDTIRVKCLNNLKILTITNCIIKGKILIVMNMMLYLKNYQT